MIATEKMFNGTNRERVRIDRYWTQWITETKEGEMRILGYCVRDMDKFDSNIVFEHHSEIVCRKIARLLNEGS